LRVVQVQVSVVALICAFALLPADAYASPTVTSHEPMEGTCLQLQAEDFSRSADEILDTSLQAKYPRLASVAEQLFTPEHSCVVPALVASSPEQLGKTRYLPGVPATFFLVATGFVCVSLVRDRRAWLAGLAALLWLGQAGLHALPQLAAGQTSFKKLYQQRGCEQLRMARTFNELGGICAASDDTPRQLLKATGAGGKSPARQYVSRRPPGQAAKCLSSETRSIPYAIIRERLLHEPQGGWRFGAIERAAGPLTILPLQSLPRSPPIYG
jgi:hypothetical protein